MDTAHLLHWTPETRPSTAHYYIYGTALLAITLGGISCGLAPSALHPCPEAINGLKQVSAIGITVSGLALTLMGPCYICCATKKIQKCYECNAELAHLIAQVSLYASALILNGIGFGINVRCL